MKDQHTELRHTYSKSRIMDLLQCPRKLWLKMHHPELEAGADANNPRLLVGQQLGELARKLFDPGGTGVLVKTGNPAQAQAKTQELLLGDSPIFEACFCSNGGMVYVDILLPSVVDGARQWKIVEVKSSTSVKDEHKDDLAFQAQIALQTGLPLAGIALAHVDNSWTYPGSDNYQGLLREVDLTDELLDKSQQVLHWLASAAHVAAHQELPATITGKHCSTPYDCGFLGYCEGLEPQARCSARMLPDVRKKALKEFLAQGSGIEMELVPDELLNETQLRVKKLSLSGDVFFDQAAAQAALSGRQYPLYFLDFETVVMTIPIWVGTRPYQQIPFQYSVHRLDENGDMVHTEFLDLSGEDPVCRFAESLLRDCGQAGTIYVYNASFEQTRIKELAARFPDMAESLLALNVRMTDLLPVAKACYYHPAQEGSWSIKAVLPAVAPDLSYDDLEGVQDGGMAMVAFQKAIAAGTSVEVRQVLDMQLRQYCKLDTYAMVRLWEYFSGQHLDSKEVNSR